MLVLYCSTSKPSQVNTCEAELKMCHNEAGQ